MVLSLRFRLCVPLEQDNTKHAERPNAAEEAFTTRRRQEPHLIRREAKGCFSVRGLKFESSYQARIRTAGASRNIVYRLSVHWAWDGDKISRDGKAHGIRQRCPGHLLVL